MKKFRVMGTVTVSCWTVVEADTPEQARQIARDRDVADIHIDGSYPNDEFWHIDTDGSPEDVRCEDDE